jgi:hypothetical protein
MTTKHLGKNIEKGKKKNRKGEKRKRKREKIERKETNFVCYLRRGHHHCISAYIKTAKTIATINSCPLLYFPGTAQPLVSEKKKEEKFYQCVPGSRNYQIFRTQQQCRNC